ncbi:SdpI family protein [Streptomyces sp. CA-294286]|uniref:SdpI family protein n=1 Tax=Streptomyces sp. CA-294286 TaxID=3240070 RepID=UPI003D9187A6
MDVAGLFIFGAGLLWTGATVHLVKNHVAKGGLGRNAAIGIRTRATTSSDTAWEAGHAAAAPLLTATCRTAYAAGALTWVSVLVLVLSDSGTPVVVALPAGGTVAVLVLLSAAARRANAAARAAGDADGRPGP